MVVDGEDVKLAEEDLSLVFDEVSLKWSILGGLVEVNRN